MSVVVASSPVAMFKGDGLDLLDRLVEACNQRPSTPAAGPLKERGLVGFDWHAWELPSAKPSTSSPSSGAKLNSAKASAGKAGSSNKRAASPPSSTKTSANASPSGSPPRRKHQNNSGSCTVAAPGPAAPAVSAPAALSPSTPALLLTPRAGCGVGPIDTGCPSFFTSPKPEVLPMPTSGLLSRALTAKA